MKSIPPLAVGAMSNHSAWGELSLAKSGWEPFFSAQGAFAYYHHRAWDQCEWLYLVG